MKVRVISVGKPADPESSALHDRYSGRLRALGIDYATAWVPDVRPGGRYSDEHVRERESDALVAAAGTKVTLVAVDRTGELLSTPAFAERLVRWATPCAVFLIGGPMGHHETLRARAGAIWSLSPLTFPHELSRALVAEQVYRAATILRGSPYHK